MKKPFAQRFQNLSQKAAQLKQAVDAAPAQAAHFRDTLLMTAGQLQQMRQDVQSSVTGLRADSDDRLAQALREINDSKDTFEEAGYALIGVDMELSPTQRLIVHFEKIESVPEPKLRALLSAHSGRQTVYALLAALAKADGVSEKVRLSHLTYRELIIHVGPTPSVRLCWHADTDDDETPAPAHAHAHAAPTPHASAPAASPSPSIPPPPLPAFASSTYFEQRPAGLPAGLATAPAPQPVSPPTVATAPVPMPMPVPPTVPASTTSYVSTTGSSYIQPMDPASGGDWKKSALDRFKKMPDGSKYRR